MSSVKVEGIEINHSIQNIDLDDPNTIGDIPLIRKKVAVFRVYLDPRESDARQQVKGVLNVSGLNLDSVNWVGLGGRYHSEIKRQRDIVMGTVDSEKDVESLFFIGEIPNQEEFFVSLEKLTPNVDFAHRKFTFRTVPSLALKVRAVGLRVPDPDNPGTVLEPTEEHSLAAERIIKNAFPVSELDWKFVTIDAPKEVIALYPPNGHSEDVVRTAWNAAHSRIMALRALEIEDSANADCVYYGMVPISGTHYFGVASDVPETARFDAVALGPANNRSAHWYAAHEIGHLLGLLHPGFCRGQAKETDTPADFDGGISTTKLSHTKLSHIGMDIDPSLQSVIVLNHSKYHDLMTYCDMIWVSYHSFDLLHQRITLLNNQPLPKAAENHVFVSGTFTGLADDEVKGGSILYAFPINKTPAPHGDYGKTNKMVQIRATYAGSGRVLYPIPARNSKASGIDMCSGAFQIAIPRSDNSGKEIKKIELFVWQKGETPPDDPSEPNEEDAVDHLSFDDGLKSLPSFGDDIHDALSSAPGDLEVAVQWSAPPTTKSAFALRTIGTSAQPVEWIAFGCGEELTDWVVRIPQHLTNRLAGDFEFVNLKYLGLPKGKT